MKISLNWLLDHLICDRTSLFNIGLENLIVKFNQKVAEVESFVISKWDKDSFFAATITAVKDDQVFANVSELKKDITLSMRNDAKINGVFLVSKEKQQFGWTTLAHLELQKDGLIPELRIAADELDGKWKQHIEWQDAILEVDNKSITHRPDMWCHHGFAREIAILTNSKLKAAEEMLTALPTNKAEDGASNISNLSAALKISNLTQSNCYAFSAARFVELENEPCIPEMVFRLARVDVRPTNAIVDLTNYLTADWGQPVHAYDAKEIYNGTLVAQMASNNQKLELLDGKEIQLTKQDIVIADPEKPLALAGIMGGTHSGVNSNTSAIILESANFSAPIIRRSAQRHKLRTESSARFEKTLHSELALEAIYRFYSLAQKFGIRLKLQGTVISLCKTTELPVLRISHEFLQQRIGCGLREADVVKPLTALGFQVELNISDETPSYKITVPTHRASKDIKIAEDIVEEVARCYGFEKIAPALPLFSKQPHNLAIRRKILNAKRLLAYRANMIEQCNYVFFNPALLAQIQFDPKPTLNIKNPVNENTVQLVTTLIPGLLGNIQKNYHAAERLAFFEVGKAWTVINNHEHIEGSKIAGIFWQKRSAVDFFECKRHLELLVENFEIPAKQISWQKTTPELPWEHPHATATLYFANKILGKAGKINHLLWSNLDCLPDADGFFFELDLDVLKGHVPATIKASLMPKVQEQSFDIAFIAPHKITAQEFTQALQNLNPLVSDVCLLDQFYKAEWTDQRSLTCRIKLQSHSDTPISSQQLEQLMLQAQKSLRSLGAEVRG